MKVSAYLSFKGDCEAAFKYYAEFLGAIPGLIFRYGDSPIADVLPEGWDRKIMHGNLSLGGQHFEGADAPPDRYEQPKGFSLSLGVQSPAEADRVFQALAEGGRVVFPIEKTSWSQRFGMVVDRFGIPWMINCE